MRISDNKKNKQRYQEGLQANSQQRHPLRPVSVPVKPQGQGARNQQQRPGFQAGSAQVLPNISQSQIISGYFIQDKSYKEMAISRVNTCICVLLAFLLSVCVTGYYFVTTNEIELNKIRKETLALNYDNEEMQANLDNLQSYFNVDKEVTKTKILQPAKRVMELPAVDLPSVSYKNKKADYNPTWSMGY